MPLASIAAMVATRLPEPDRAKLSSIKLAYGAGQAGLRGVTYYDRWGRPDGSVPFVEVCAFGQESVVQLAGTTIHELGHVLAGWKAGHSQAWKDACEACGLRKVKAAGTRYSWAMFAPELREAIRALGDPVDGQPVSFVGPSGAPAVVKPCHAGFGTARQTVE